MPFFFSKVFTPGHKRRKQKYHFFFSFLLPSRNGLWWTNCAAEVVYRRSKNKKQHWQMGTTVSFRETINVACGGQKCSRPSPRPPFCCVRSCRCGFLTVSRKTIFKCVWLLNDNLHNRWMSSTALYQRNASLFQHAQRGAFTKVNELWSFGITSPNNVCWQIAY